MQLTLEIGTVDFDTSTLDTPDGPRTLRPMELKLLEHLSREPGAVHSPQRLLHEVWGYVDGVETRTLYATVNRLRLAIERDPRHPTHVVTVPRLGYRFVSLGAPLASDLPRSTTDLVGRDRDLEALVDRMESVGSATLVGPAGVGKSRLALAWATERAAAGGRVVWCPLADAKDGPAAFRALAEALGLGPAGRSAEADVRAALAGLGDATLVLDDADGVLEAVGSLPHARKLVTCRGEPGALPGEVFPLGPLDSDGVGSPAARLLEARVRDRDPAWRMPDGAPWAQPLLDAIGGLPLALELAAPWLSVFSGEELVERVGHGRATLGRRGSDRHASLVASLHWSWPLLSPVERAVLVQVAVFTGAFDLQAAREVVELPSDELLHEVVLGLVERSWLRVDPGEHGQAFRVLPGHRALVDAHGDPELLEAASARMVDGFLALAARVDPEVLHAGGGRVWERLQARCPDALAALERADGPGKAVIAGLIGRCLLQRGPLDRALEVFDRALAAADTPSLRVPLLRYRAVALRALGDVGSARVALEEALALVGAEALGRARILCALGVLEGYHGTPGNAEARFQESLAAFREAGAPLDMSVVQAELATLRFLAGDLHGAAELLEGALAPLREAGGGWVYAMYLGNLGGIEQVADHLESAALHLQEALALHRRFGSARGASLALGNLALVELRRGELEPARAHLEEGLALARRSGDRGQQGNLCSTLGLVALHLGDPAEAIRQLDTALGIAEVLSIPRLRAEALVRRARVRAALGEPDLALEELALAEAICEELELRNEWVEAGLLRVELALGDGDARAAQAALQDTERRGEGGHVPDLEVWRARVREAASGQGARQPA